ncbi:uncharacterized protein LOC144872106 [Branchiostoma floridae x Branchiostoma japonicum]
MGTNTTYPITKYQVSSDEEPRGGRYLFPALRFRVCNDICDVSVVVKDDTAPQILSCPRFNLTLQRKSCRNVNLYDYYNSSTLASWFQDNVGVTDVICTQSTLHGIAIGETASITCQAKDMIGNPSAACDVTFHCMKHVCPSLTPPESGALVCHEDHHEQRCALLCKEGKIPTRQNIFKCDMANPLPTWRSSRGTDVGAISCGDKGRHKSQFTFNITCDPNDLAFHREVKRTLAYTRSWHHLCNKISDGDCKLTVSCGNNSGQVTETSLSLPINETFQCLDDQTTNSSETTPTVMFTTTVPPATTPTETSTTTPTETSTNTPTETSITPPSGTSTTTLTETFTTTPSGTSVTAPTGNSVTTQIKTSTTTPTKASTTTLTKTSAATLTETSITPLTETSTTTPTKASTTTLTETSITPLTETSTTTPTKSSTTTITETPITPLTETSTTSPTGTFTTTPTETSTASSTEASTTSLTEISPTTIAPTTAPVTMSTSTQNRATFNSILSLTSSTTNTIPTVTSTSSPQPSASTHTLFSPSTSSTTSTVTPAKTATTGPTVFFRTAVNADGMPTTNSPMPSTITTKSKGLPTSVPSTHSSFPTYISTINTRHTPPSQTHKTKNAGLLQYLLAITTSPSTSTGSIRSTGMAEKESWFPLVPVTATMAVLAAVGFVIASIVCLKKMLRAPIADAYGVQDASHYDHATTDVP